MSNTDLDTLGHKLAQAALTVLVRSCRQEIASAKQQQQLEDACAAMRIQSGRVIEQLLDDVRAAPWLGEQAFASATLTLAEAGIRVLRKSTGTTSSSTPTSTPQTA